MRRVGRERTFRPPKARRERTIPLPSSVALALARHIERFPPSEVTLPWSGQGRAQDVTARLIFTAAGGGDLAYSTFADAWGRALDAAGVERSPEHGPHILRHSCASWLLAEGCPVHAGSEYLGHADAATTLRYYAHLVRSEPDRMRAAIDRALESAPDVRAAGQG